MRHYMDRLTHLLPKYFAKISMLRKSLGVLPYKEQNLKKYRLTETFASFYPN